ncbi:MAG: 2-oxo acid dehydrogenase subunit E2 [Clostridia bacterium]|nr:2-oxo acid dehydrogenase subunit E2 [Clostridia bacterium]
MAKAVIMPKAGITVESCIIGKWLKNVGDQVKVGDILYTYETDKASFECESTEEGEILAIFFKDGDEVPCFTNVCAIGAKGEKYDELIPQGASSAEAPKAEASPAEAAPAPAPAPVAAAAEKTVSADGSVKVSPRARTLAEKAGVNAADAEPTGPDGRIIERDVRKLMETGAPVKAESAKTAVAAPAPAAVPETEYEDVKFSGIRKAIAKSMMSSLHNTAQLTNHHSFDATAIQAYRKECKAAGGDVGGITLGDMVLYAVSRTILAWPDINANMIDDTTIRRFRHVNLGVAVDTPRGLMVPTIFNADTKSLLEISKEVKTLAEAARSGAISPDLLTGASFTVSNLGSTGVEMFTPVINPPQTAILGVCGIVNRVKAGADGQIKMYPAMGLSLTYDHRAVDGSPASKFVSELAKNLEKFTLLLAK